MNAQTSFDFQETPERLEGFSVVGPDDVPDIVALGDGFYTESELSSLTPFNPDRFAQTLLSGLEGGFLHGFLFCSQGVPAGFVFYTLDQTYTKDPLAYIWLLYVVPSLRKTPAGRLMLDLVEKGARARGAVALYGGVMAGIDEVKTTRPNLYRKQGFEPLYWGRKVLREDED
jgi:GNAT superfamily N-acetyltransferase